MEDQNPDQDKDQSGGDATGGDGSDNQGEGAGAAVENLHEMHWSALKKMCEFHGIEYKGKEQAIAELTAIKEATGSSESAPAAPIKGGARLNTRLPFGDIFGDVEGAPGARYCQGGCFYNGEGEKVG